MTAQRADFSQALNRREPPEAVKWGVQLELQDNRGILVDQARAISVQEMERILKGGSSVLDEMLERVLKRPPRNGWPTTSTGQAQVRVFCPDGARLQVNVDYPPSVLDKWYEIKWYWGRAPGSSPGTSDQVFSTVTLREQSRQSVVRVGRQSMWKVEPVNFNGSSEVSLQYGYDNPAITTLFAGYFYNASGQQVSAPKYRAGVFRAPEPVWGAMIVGYTVGYDLYEINYEFPPDGGDPRGFSLQIDNRPVVSNSFDMMRAYKLQAVTYGKVDLPPITLTAFYSGGAAVLSIPRLLEALAPMTPPADDEKDKSNEEKQREYQETTERRIYAEGSSTVYIDVEEPTRMVFTDPVTNRKFVLNLPPETA